MSEVADNEEEKQLLTKVLTSEPNCIIKDKGTKYAWTPANTIPIKGYIDALKKAKSATWGGKKKGT